LQTGKLSNALGFIILKHKVEFYWRNPLLLGLPVKNLRYSTNKETFLAVFVS